MTGSHCLCNRIEYNILREYSQLSIGCPYFIDRNHIRGCTHIRDSRIASPHFHDFLCGADHGFFQAAVYQIASSGPCMIFSRRCLHPLSCPSGILSAQNIGVQVFGKSFFHTSIPYMAKVFQPLKIGYGNTTCIQVHIRNHQTPFFISISSASGVSGHWRLHQLFLPLSVLHFRR